MYGLMCVGAQLRCCSSSRNNCRRRCHRHERHHHSRDDHYLCGVCVHVNAYAHVARCGASCVLYADLKLRTLIRIWCRVSIQLFFVNGSVWEDRSRQLLEIVAVLQCCRVLDVRFNASTHSKPSRSRARVVRVCPSAVFPTVFAIV